MGVCLLSSFFLFKTRYVRYLMAFWCICFIRSLMLDLGIFSLVNFSMKCSWMAPLTPALMVMMGLVFHPLFCMVFINGSYFCVFSGDCLFGEFVMTVCEFDKLDCVCWGW